MNLMAIGRPATAPPMASVNGIGVQRSRVDVMACRYASRCWRVASGVVGPRLCDGVSGRRTAGTRQLHDDLDRAVYADHLTSLFVPELVAPVGSELVRFAELVRTLRAQCPR